MYTHKTQHLLLYIAFNETENCFFRWKFSDSDKKSFIITMMIIVITIAIII